MSERLIDEELVKRAQEGQRQAFDILVLKYQHRIAKLIRRYVNDSHEVMDITQESFIKAYRALPNFRNECAFYTWLYRIAINTAKNYTTSRGMQMAEVEIKITEQDQFNYVPSLIEDSSPERLLLRDEIGLAVSETVEQLPEDLRMAIILREIEGFSYEEIANVMECPVGTVRSRLYRAREAIDVRIKPLMGDDHEK